MKITKTITALTPTRPLTRNADGEIITLRRVQEIPADWSHMGVGAMRARIAEQEAHAAKLADEARCEADGFITVYRVHDATFTGFK
ncbi:hypothetical protein [Roseicitreum antarcticum]|uniref:hypothetical protein n=1 Tax=Roseicitreum antarcticum TaxID=564137 RepID=UPI0016809E7B|nr:hypothetical protein [Roseicitreum antarcticum]